MFNAPWPNSSPPRALSSLTVSLSRPRPMAMSGAHEDKDANDDNRWEASAYMAKFNKIQYALFLAHHVWTHSRVWEFHQWKKWSPSERCSFWWFLKWFTSNSSTFWVISDQTKIPENLAEFATSEAPTAGAHGRVATCQKGRPRRPPGRGVGKFTSKPSENSVRISLDFPWLWEVGWAWFILMMDDEVQKIWYHCLDYTCRPCYI